MCLPKSGILRVQLSRIRVNGAIACQSCDTATLDKEKWPIDARHETWWVRIGVQTELNVIENEADNVRKPIESRRPKIMMQGIGL
jgi:hypothetical protein